MSKINPYTIKPLSDRMVVEVPAAEAETTGGIIIPDSAKREPPMSATVVSKGPSAHECKVGDKVFFRKHAGIKLDDSNCRMLEEVEILAVQEGAGSVSEELRAFVMGAANG